MRVRVYGEPTRLSREEIRYACQWAGGRLLGELSRHVSVSVHLWDNRYRWCAGLTPLDRKIRPRHFRIDMNAQRFGRRGQLLGIFHEQAHIDQYARGEMIDNYRAGPATLFRNTLHDPNEVDYEDLPWEVEAFRMEKVLYREYRSHLKSMGH